MRNLGTNGVFQSTHTINADCPFILKMNKDGSLKWFTYFLSERSHSFPKGFDVDDEGNTYISYDTDQLNAATPGAYQEQLAPDEYSNYFSRDLLITKINNQGSRIWATYYGGNHNENNMGLHLDKLNDVLYIIGNTKSKDLIHPSNTIDPTEDVIVRESAGLLIKFDTEGNYIWSSYTLMPLTSFALSNNGDLVLAGANNNATQNSPQFESTTGFFRLSSYSKDFNLNWTRGFLGEGNGGHKLKLDNNNNNNNIIVGGITYSRTEIATENAYSPTYQFELDKYSSFLKKYDQNGSEIFGTYIGAEGFTDVSAIEIGLNNEIYLVGNASSENKILYGNTRHFMGTSRERSSNFTDNFATLLKFSENGQPIWGMMYGDEIGQQAFSSIAIDNTTKDIVVGGYSNANYFNTTPNGYQPYPFIPVGFQRDIDQGLMVLFNETENEFNIKFSGEQCDITSIVLTAEGATNYTWYDNNWNIVGNSAVLRPTAEGHYTCKFEHQGNEGYINYYVRITSPNTPPSPVITVLPEITAYCFVDLIAPKAISACGEEIIATTTRTHLDSPGSYQITWLYTDNFGNTFSQNQQVNILSEVELIPANIVLTICENNEIGYNLTSILPNLPDADYKFYADYMDLVNQISIQNPSNFINTENYEFILIEGVLTNGCRFTQEIKLEVNPKPFITPITKTICDTQNDGFINIDLSNLANEISDDQSAIIKFYLDQYFQNQITSTQRITHNQTIYYKIIEQNGCENSSTITFELTNYNVLTTNTFTICKELDTFGIFDLATKKAEIASLLNSNQSNIYFYKTLRDAQNGVNPLSENYINEDGLSIIYASSSTDTACKTLIEIPLQENIIPTIILEDVYYKCKDSELTITLNDNYDEIIWSNGNSGLTSNLTQPGTYEVTVKNNECYTTKTFEIKDYSPINYTYLYDGNRITFTLINDTKVSIDQRNWIQNNFILEP
ncbi:hypothetical protein EAH69_04905 [Faecalibacter macacae]|uniref:Ig-like domain-containing protein n=2 Tax=Faecalibacter macacae TaxID=1859289 RepID=A0A3L9MER5_9FLAO|nr:hypothetical protein EAH69_04905 [Faecalibacter macacae]